MTVKLFRYLQDYVSTFHSQIQNNVIVLQPHSSLEFKIFQYQYHNLFF